MVFRHQKSMQDSLAARFQAIMMWIDGNHWSSCLYLIFIVLLLHIIYLGVKYVIEYRADAALAARYGCQPPPQLPNRRFLGIDRLLELVNSNAEGHLLAFITSVAADYEPRNQLSQFMFFGPRMYHTLHPRNIEAVLSTKFQDYSLGVRHGVFAPLLGNGIFTQEGVAWKHSRELFRKQFSRAQYQNLDHFQEHVDNLIARLPAQEGVVDLQPLFFDLTLDAATALLLGKSVYSLTADENNNGANIAFAESFTVAQEGLAARFRIAPWHFLYSPNRFRRACSTAHRFVEDYIRERDLQKNADTEGSYGFIDQVAKESKSLVDIRDQLMNVLLAGRDTTACCLSWTLRLLVRHPLVLERLREEVASVISEGEHLSRSHIKKMTFLGHIIKESIRLYPPVPLNNRTAIRSTILPTGGGPDDNSPILVRRGEVISLSQYVNSRKKNLYGPDADDFRPERWETGELSDIGWAYFPFGGGHRTCLGEDFAVMEVSYTVVRLLQTFPVIALPDGEKNETVGTERQRLTLVLTSADGCRVQLARYK